jgi:leucyl-tRNA synthetase
MMPHLAETCWQALGHDALVVDESWPKADPELVRSDVVTYAIQVNGKLRATHQFAKDADQSIIETTVLKLPEVVRALDGKEPKRKIVVPNRIVNIVA